MIELGTIPGGYGWVFPKGDHVNVGVGGWESEGPRLRMHLDELCRRHGIESDGLESVRGHRLPLRRGGFVPARGRMLLVGDAAGLVDPLTGGPATPTMAAFMQWLPRGFRGDASRSTDSTVYCAVEGEGESRVGDRTIAWRAHDVFVVPSWTPVRHETDGDAVLFSFSDRPVQQALKVWREEAVG